MLLPFAGRSIQECPTARQRHGWQTIEESPESILIDIDGPPPWWDAAFAYRLPVAVDAAGHDRVDFVAEVAVDWTARLTALGDSAAMQLDSLRVVEIDANGAVVDPAVPCQFDPDPTFDALTNATGTLMLQLVGATAGSATRSYHVYFDTTPGFTPAVVAAAFPLLRRGSAERAR